MKNAAPYQPTLSRPLNSSVIFGMAVATMVWDVSYVTVKDGRRTYHV
jgi:hypothetical protein